VFAQYGICSTATNSVASESQRTLQDYLLFYTSNFDNPVYEHF